MDFKKANHYYLLAANQGLDRAQCNLGLAYHYGLGKTVNYVKACQWYRLAANQGLARALYHLGDLYENGLGVNRSWYEAYKLYSLAANKNQAARIRLEHLGYEIENNVTLYMTQNQSPKPSYLSFCNFLLFISQRYPVQILDDVLVKSWISKYLGKYFKTNTPEFDETIMQEWFNVFFGHD